MNPQVHFEDVSNQESLNFSIELSRLEDLITKNQQKTKEDLSVDVTFLNQQKRKKVSYIHKLDSQDDNISFFMYIPSSIISIVPPKIFKVKSINIKGISEKVELIQYVQIEQYNLPTTCHMWHTISGKTKDQSEYLKLLEFGAISQTLKKRREYLDYKVWV